jgi:hypothetical protein
MALVARVTSGPRSLLVAIHREAPQLAANINAGSTLRKIRVADRF